MELSPILASVTPYIPLDLFGQAGQSVGLVAYIGIFSFYAVTAAWTLSRWLVARAASKAALGFALTGLLIFATAPAVAMAVQAGALPAAWAGAWAVGAAAPFLMFLARFMGHGGEESEVVGGREQGAVAGDHEKLMSLLSQTSDGIFTVNRQGRVEMMNAAAEKLLGVNARELQGQGLGFMAERVKFYTDGQEPLPVEQWAVTKALREGTIANEQSLQLFPFKSKGLFLKVSASLLRDKQGKVSTVICVLKDRTAHRQLEILKDELFSKPLPIQELGGPAPAEAPVRRAPPAVPAAPPQAAPAADGQTLSAYLKAFLWEQSGEATRMGVSFLDQIPSVLPETKVAPQALKKALAGLIQYAINSTATGGMVRVWASAKEDKVFIAVRDGGMGMIPDEVTRFSDNLETSSTTRGDQTKNPLYPLIVAREELAALGLHLNVRSDGLKKGTEYYFLLPSVGAWILPQNS